MNESVIIKNCQPFYMNPSFDALPVFQTEDYLTRLYLLQAKMEESDLSHVLVYADREHFANMDYLIGHDPRFEEALLVIDRKNHRTLFVGNEGWGHTQSLPIPVERVLFQSFSLQGQPRDKSKPLHKHLAQLGIGKDSRLGLIGYKYFIPKELTRAESRTDFPMWLIEEILRLTPKDRLTNVTSFMTGLPHGVRMNLRTAKEVAYYEQIAERTAQSVIRMFKLLKPGISEMELTAQAAMDAFPISAFPMIQFGEEHVSIGLRSPNEQILQLGDPVCLCRALRGALVSRAGIAAYDEATLHKNRKRALQDFYIPYWSALATWYETVGIGVNGGALYQCIHERIGSHRFGLQLNPGHNIGADEWTNSPVYKGSNLLLTDGMYLQSDVIASHSTPVYTAIMEDGLVLAGEHLRQQLALQYPKTWSRIQERQAFMKDTLGVRIKEEVLPLSSLCGVYFPFFLDTTQIFAKV